MSPVDKSAPLFCCRARPLGDVMTCAPAFCATILVRPVLPPSATIISHFLHPLALREEERNGPGVEKICLKASQAVTAEW